MLKAYAVALVLSTSTPVTADTQESARPLEKPVAEQSQEVKGSRPGHCECGIIFR